MPQPETPRLAGFAFQRPAPTSEELAAQEAPIPTGRPIHPAANLFPMMPLRELELLAKDIKDNGQREPIVLLGEELLDGRNRAAACKLAGVEPLTRQWNGEGGSPFSFVISANLHRRQLDATQKAKLALQLKPHFEQEARERMLRGVVARPGVSAAFALGEEHGRSRAHSLPPTDVAAALHLNPSKTTPEQEEALWSEYSAGLNKGREERAHPGVTPTPGARREEGRAIVAAAQAAGAGVSSTKRLEAAAKRAPEILDVERKGVRVEDLVAAAELPPAQRAEVLDQLKKGERPKKQQQQPKPEPKPAKAQPRHMHPLADALFQVDDAEQALQGALQYLKEQGGPEVGLVAKQVEKLLGEMSKVVAALESIELPPPPEWKTWHGAKWKPTKEEAMRRILLFLEKEGPQQKMHLAQAVGFWDATSDPNANIFNNAVAQLQRDGKITNKGGAWQLMHKPKRK